MRVNEFYQELSKLSFFPQCQCMKRQLAVKFFGHAGLAACELSAQPIKDQQENNCHHFEIH
jgi:hypothetical protein